MEENSNPVKQVSRMSDNFSAWWLSKSTRQKIYTFAVLSTLGWCKSWIKSSPVYIQCSRFYYQTPLIKIESLVVLANPWLNVAHLRHLTYMLNFLSGLKKCALENIYWIELSWSLSDFAAAYFCMKSQCDECLFSAEVMHGPVAGLWQSWGQFNQSTCIWSGCE